MDEQTRELDLQLADLMAENKRLKRIEQAAHAVMNAFSHGIDYDNWDKALDKLEAVLKEKP